MTPDDDVPPPQPGDPGFDEADLSNLSEEELRAVYEEEIARVTVDDVLVQTVVSLLNLAARKAGLTGAADEPDFEQVRQAIDATTALLPLVEPSLGPDAKQIRDALSQLQLAYARSGAVPPPDAPRPGEPATPSSTSRGGSGLWVPGQ